MQSFSETEKEEKRRKKDEIYNDFFRGRRGRIS
jgi:hypothetical protein